MVKIIKKLNRVGNKIDLTIHDEDWRKIGHFRFNQSEFPSVCKILKSKYGIEYRPSIPFNERINFANNRNNNYKEVVKKEDNKIKEEVKDAGWLGKKDKDYKSPNWLDI